jgi:hypothetical protein
LLYGKETHLIRRGKEPYRIKCCQWNLGWRLEADAIPAQSN